MPLRVGTDLVAVSEVERSLRAFPERYLERVFTPTEVSDCAGDPQKLAGRFAAKEAACKVLRPNNDPLPLRSIEVRRQEGGWVALDLHDEAAALAARANISDLALSITHEGGFASAVVVASTNSETDR